MRRSIRFSTIGARRSSNIPGTSGGVRRRRVESPMLTSRLRTARPSPTIGLRHGMPHPGSVWQDAIGRCIALTITKLWPPNEWEPRIHWPALLGFQCPQAGRRPCTPPVETCVAPYTACWLCAIQRSPIFWDRCAICVPCHELGSAPVGLMVMGHVIRTAGLLRIAAAVEALVAPHIQAPGV